MKRDLNNEKCYCCRLQWGDEGKGKIVDWLSSEADVVVRFQGGHNWPTLRDRQKVFKLRLLPSGIVRKGKISILGNGVVIDLGHSFRDKRNKKTRSECNYRKFL